MAHGRLWFADWTAGAIRTFSGAHASRVEIEHRSLALCFDFLPDSTLELASGPEQAILAASAGNVLTRYADLSGLSRYGSNDIVADGRGNIYVDNVNFHFAAGPPDGEPAPGFIALVTPDGQTRVVAEDLAFPNGMAVHGRQRHPRRRRVISASAHGLRHRLRRFAGEPPRVGAGGGSLTRRHLP